ncbi:MAG: hypothetical protein WBD36_06605 [Bacteroidota bacterium]
MTPFLSRPFRIVALILLVVSLVCTQIPLLNYLGFEFSVLTAVVAGYMAGLLSLFHWGRETTPPDENFWHVASRISLASVSLLIIPLIVITANAFFIRNCSFPQGFVLYVLITIPAVLLTATVAMVVGASIRRWRKTWFTIIILIILLHIPYVTFTGSQIFAFNPIVGFFPGLTYDEHLPIVERLILYRISTLVYVGALLIIAALIRRSWQLSQRDWILGLFVLILIGFAVLSDRMGLSSSESYIRKTLGGLYQTEHFDIVYPSDLVKPDQVEQIALLHEFTLHQLRNELKINPTKRMTTFLYGTAEQKGLLFGAARTDVAKPWLRQLHLNLEDVPVTLKHELVHVLAGEFGIPILRISVQPGLIEGTAVAVERLDYDELVHRTAAQIIASGLLPDMHKLFSLSGFSTVNPGVSYSIAGSFCRFLMDRYGLRRFKWLYQSGDFFAVYGRDLDSLVREWALFMKGFHTTEGEARKANYLFKRPTIFGKECARVIANTNARTRSLLGQRDFAAALSSAELSLSLSRSSEATFQKASALLELQQFTKLIEFAESELKDTVLGPNLLTMRLSLGDAYWAAGAVEKASGQYELLLATHLTTAWDEACALRLEVLSSAGERDSLTRFFTVRLPDSVRLDFLKRRTSSVGKYLLGREQASKERFGESIDAFQSVGKLNSPLLEFLCRQRIARSCFALREYQHAKMYFWESLNFTTDEAQIVRTREWLDRCEWTGQASDRR